MPMIPEALVAMLACARLGAVHSVVFGGFAANELAVRLDDATPKVSKHIYCLLWPPLLLLYHLASDSLTRTATPITCGL